MKVWRSDSIQTPKRLDASTSAGAPVDLPATPAEASGATVDAPAPLAEASGATSAGAPVDLPATHVGTLCYEFKKCTGSAVVAWHGGWKAYTVVFSGWDVPELPNPWRTLFTA